VGKSKGLKIITRQDRNRGGKESLQSECNKNYERDSPPAHVSCHSERQKDAEYGECLLVVNPVVFVR